MYLHSDSLFVAKLQNGTVRSKACFFKILDSYESVYKCMVFKYEESGRVANINELPVKRQG